MPPSPIDSSHALTRRTFLGGSGALILGGLTAHDRLLAAEPDRRAALRIAMVTDLHYADKPAWRTRHYRAALPRLRDAADHFRADPPDLAVCLGDLIDKDEAIEREVDFLRTIDAAYARFHCERHYVLGNHCVDTLTKAEFLEHTGATAPHYAFDAGRFHIVVLDACYRADGQPYGRGNSEWKDANLPADQIDWLRADLARTDRPTIVFAHQRLDGEGDYYVNNAVAVREVLEASGKVLAVFQGHSHHDDYRQLAGIHYCTLVAMVEGVGDTGGAYAEVSLFEDHSIRLSGFRQQPSRLLAVSQPGRRE